MRAESREQRAEWIDVVRGLGMLCVILGHISSPLKPYIYSFHMPYFFILSGFLFKPGIKDYTTKLFKRLIIPYFILCLINLIIQSIIQFQSLGIYSISNYLFGIVWSYGTTKYMPNCSPLWFLTCLFISLVLFNYIYSKLYGIKYFIVIWFLFFAGIYLGNLLNYFVLPLPWNVDIALVALSFIALGREIRKKNIIQTICSSRLLGAFIAILIIIWYQMVIINIDPHIDFDARNYGNYLAMFVGSIALSFAVICIVVQMHFVNRNKVLIFLGQHTIFLMGFDYFSESIAKVVFRILHMHSWAMMFVIKCLVLFIGLFIWQQLCLQIKHKGIRNLLLNV